MTEKRYILTTTALIYANGPLHLGHVIEQIQADIWVRFQKLCGHDCLFISGDDAHGTAIMLSAEKQKQSPEAVIEAVYQSHKKDSEDFLIDFDLYYTTHASENQSLVHRIYAQLQKNQDISQSWVEQAYDEKAQMFLPDRFIKGTCPRCQACEQHGDSCEVCGATYSPTDLKNPRSVLTGTSPVYRRSLQYFFQLDKYQARLEQWLQAGHLQKSVVSQLKAWFKEGLQAWNISRDAPYFGFEIPDAPGKYFYVWLDAPIGYMATFQKLSERLQNEALFDRYWPASTQTELVHFIGKDIVYFHALFWPALLMGSGFRTPTRIHAHGFLTVNGEKMSKSKGTFIKARDYLTYLDPEYLRYYFAAKLTAGTEDINLQAADFLQRVNSDLVGKVINIASRSAGFIHRYFDDCLSDTLSHAELFNTVAEAGVSIANDYDRREYQQAVRNIMSLADLINRYIDEKKPWEAIKHDDKRIEVLHTASMGINLFKQLMVYLKPILPNTAKKVESFLNIPPMTWADAQTPLLSHKIEPFSPLMYRVDKTKLSKVWAEGSMA